VADPYESIIGLLTEEVDLQRRLLELVRDAQRALVRGRPVELAEVVTQQEEVVAEIRRLECARLEIRALLAEREGRRSDEITLSALVRSVRPDMAARFEHLHDSVAAVLREVADVNKTNALLIREHITQLRTAVDMVAGQVM
jgi:flagellar biosynthesis/type III secretory pathway chaperone